MFARALEPLVADEVWDHPVIVDKVGVEMRAVRAIVTVLALMISRTDGRAKVLVGDDRNIRDYLAIHRRQNRDTETHPTNRNGQP